MWHFCAAVVLLTRNHFLEFKEKKSSKKSQSFHVEFEISNIFINSRSLSLSTELTHLADNRDSTTVKSEGKLTIEHET
jgi:hypothetical protein